MKTTHVLLPLLGFTLMVVAGESPTTNSPVAVKASVTTNTVTNSTAVSAPSSLPPAAVTLADQKSLEQIGERIALSGALTKASPSRTRTVLQLFNPLAPVPAQPQSGWIERSAWSTVATAGGVNSDPIEMRHESVLGVVVSIH